VQWRRVGAGTHKEQEEGTMTCQKCNGLMVKEWRPEFSQEAAVLRCINCGLVLDPLIAQNRVTPLRAKQRVLNAA
jgi:transcription elongation factor Elf1